MHARVWDAAKSVDNNAWLWAKLATHRLWDGAAARRTLLDTPERYEAVQVFCNFIGHPRSGHSVVGSILDAHPGAAVSHRLDALRFLPRSVPAEAVYYRIERNAARFARSGRKLTAYAYPVAGQWQGRYDSLRMVGDQEAKWATLRLGADPNLLNRAAWRRRPRFRFIHVVRDPFDNITTWAHRSNRGLNAASRAYFDLCQRVDRIRAIHGTRVLEVHHADLVAGPHRTIAQLFGFVGLPVSDDLVTAGAAVVHRVANRTRETGRWTPELRDSVRRRATGHTYLQRYLD